MCTEGIVLVEIKILGPQSDCSTATHVPAATWPFGEHVAIKQTLCTPQYCIIIIIIIILLLFIEFSSEYIVHVSAN